MGGAKIGNNAIIDCNAAVIDDVPPNVIVGGMPARTIKKRSMEVKK